MKKYGLISVHLGISKLKVNLLPCVVGSPLSGLDAFPENATIIFYSMMKVSRGLFVRKFP